MRFILGLLLFFGIVAHAKAHHCGVFLSDFHPQNAYSTSCVKKTRVMVKYKPRAPLNTMAYVNPPARSIYNHPARGMKHVRQETQRVTYGTPMRRVVAYPYLELRDRDAPLEWRVR